MKKLIAFLIGSGIIAISIVMSLDFFNVPTQAEANPPTPKTQAQPKFIPYMFLFQHLSTINGWQWQVDELRGKSGLSAEQFGKVMRTANEYADEVAEYDSIARGIIEEFHRRFPPGRLPDGEGPGDPPVELIELQARRDDAAIRHRERLRIELGDDYHQFETFVDVEVRSKMSERRSEPLYKEEK